MDGFNALGPTSRADHQAAFEWTESLIGGPIVVDKPHMGSYNANYVVTSVPGGQRTVLRVPLQGVRELDLRVLNESDILTAFQATSHSTPAPRILGSGPGGAMLLEYVGVSMLEEVAPKGQPVGTFELDQLISAVAWLHTDDRGLHSAFNRGLSSMALPNGSTFETNRSYLLRVWDLIWTQSARFVTLLGLPAPEELASITETLVSFPRRVSLLHGDIHRKNVRTDRERKRISIIDWEMAQVGDPLYDIAVAVWKLKLPPAQSDYFIDGWVDQLPADSTEGWRRDLPGYVRLETIKTACVHFVRAVDLLSRSAPETQERICGEYASNLRDAAVFLPGLVADDAAVSSVLSEAARATSRS